MKKYTLIEALKKLKENPRLVFHDPFNPSTKITASNGGWIVNGDDECINVNLNTEWCLEVPPVSFMEAIRARSQGKKIYCEYGSEKLVYDNDTLYDSHGEAIDIKEILEGKWFIEEGELSGTA